jgi:putative hydrolase of the HAD superfamily
VGFDAYGVMTPPPYDHMEHYATTAGAPPGVISAAFRTNRWLEDVQRGEVPVDAYITEVTAEIRRAHGVVLRDSEIARCLAASRSVIPDVVALVRAVRRVCRVGLLTNNIRDSPLWAPALNEDLFDVIVDASAGVRKPEPTAYVALAEAFGEPPEHVAFVDDSPSNLDPARALGMRTVLFHDARQCGEELRALGIDIATPGREEVCDADIARPDRR